MDWTTCKEKFGENICKLNYFVKAEDESFKSIGSPLLCAEHGSVTLRATQGPIFDGYHQFQAGDYNVAAVGSNKLNNQIWHELAQYHEQ